MTIIFLALVLFQLWSKESDSAGSFTTVLLRFPGASEFPDKLVLTELWALTPEIPIQDQRAYKFPCLLNAAAAAAQSPKFRNSCSEATCPKW